jgi:hypothetical protein
MFILSWVFDKLGYMPKFSIDVNHPFSATQQDHVAPEFEQPVAKKATTVAKKKPADKKVVAKKTVRKKA